MTACRTSAWLPGGYVDQIVRREQFARGHCDAEITHHALVWVVSLTVGRTPRTTRQDMRTHA